MQAARRLRRRTFRERAGACLAEGPSCISEALVSPHDVRELFASEEAPIALVEEAEARGIPVHWVTDTVLRSITDTVTPQGAVAVVSAPDRGLQELPADVDLVLVLAEVRDPGNAGTLARSALAGGASAVVFPQGTVDPFGPKTVRASAGTIFHLTVVHGVGLSETITAARDAGLLIFGTEADAPHSVYETDLTRPFALVLGNESWGLSDETRATVDELVSIPMPGPAESLNVAVAGSVILFESARQRRVSRSDRR